MRSKRNYAMLAFLVGCGLRRGELLGLNVRSIQMREEHWVVADLQGKAGHIRTIPIPTWVKNAINEWTSASGITEGCLFRTINKAGRIGGTGMTPKVLWEVVRNAAKVADIEKLAPHDLRRTCARLCHLAGGKLRPDSVPARPRFHSDDGAVSGLQTKATVCGQRQAWNRTVTTAAAQGADYPPLADQAGSMFRAAVEPVEHHPRDMLSASESGSGPGFPP